MNNFFYGEISTVKKKEALSMLKIHNLYNKGKFICCSLGLCVFAITVIHSVRTYIHVCVCVYIYIHSFTIFIVKIFYRRQFFISSSSITFRKVLFDERRSVCEKFKRNVKRVSRANESSPTELVCQIFLEFLFSYNRPSPQ